MQNSDSSHRFNEIDAAKNLLGDLLDDFDGKVARYQKLIEISLSLGSGGTLLFGGETSFALWTEVRSSFVHGNYVATIILTQGLAENALAARLRAGVEGQDLPARVTFRDVIARCKSCKIIDEQDDADLQRLMKMRNPLTHFRSLDDPTNRTRRAIDSMVLAEDHLKEDAGFAIEMAVRLLSLPAFRVDN